MRKWWKAAGWTAGVLVLALGAAVFAGLQLADRKMARKVEVPAALLEAKVPGDAASLERGRYLYASRGCVDCHGANGTGKVFVTDGKDLLLKGPNITAGPGGVVARYRDADWVRAIRHGVSPEGRALMVMPSEDYNRLTDADVGALIAYAKSLPPAAGTGAEIRLPLPARVLYGFGGIHDAAARIDHQLPPAAPVPEGINVQHGAYVANTCIGCHGAQLTGGRIPGGPPDWPAAANLTPVANSGMAAYADPEAFMRMFRTGKRPDGSAIQVMPFGALGAMNETDMKALHLYLKSLPPRS